MQLWQLGLLVAGGISLIVYLVHAAGGSQKAKLVNIQAALDRFADDYPDIKPVGGYLTSDGTAAFLELPDRSLGLVQAFGDRFLTRVITATDVLKVSAQDLRIRLEFSDFSFKSGTYDFAQKSTHQSVRKLLSKMGAVDA
jgi:hypothetical protein